MIYVVIVIAAIVIIFALAGLLVWLLIKKYRQKRGQE